MCGLTYMLWKCSTCKHNQLVTHGTLSNAQASSKYIQVTRCLLEDSYLLPLGVNVISQS